MLPEPEVVRPYVYYIKKLALMFSFQSTNFHSNRIIGCKDITVWVISRLCVYFQNRKCYQKFEKSFFLFIFYTSCANFSFVALIVVSES